MKTKDKKMKDKKMVDKDPEWCESCLGWDSEDCKVCHGSGFKPELKNTEQTDDDNR
jgi:hypothetical protein